MPFPYFFPFYFADIEVYKFSFGWQVKNLEDKLLSSHENKLASSHENKLASSYEDKPMSSYGDKLLEKDLGR